MDNGFDAAAYPNIDKFHQEPVLMLLSGAGGARKTHRFPTGKAPSLKHLLGFFKKHSAALRERWAEVKELLDAQNAHTLAQREARRQRDQQSLEAAETATAEELCCSGDGGVVKRTLLAGEGAVPPEGARITAHYTGRLVTPEDQLGLAGPIFDSSRERGEPFGFTLGAAHVIRGWDEGFAKMRVGERALLTVAAKYAYGEEGSPPKIPPKATLAFDVELISFETKEETAAKLEL